VIDFATIIQVAGSFGIVVVPAIMLNRWLAGDEGASLADVLAIPIDPPWPRGVQEEEPVRWRLEALRPSRDRARAPEPADRRAARPGVQLAADPCDCRAA
jgi:hypothetical protein